MLRHNMASAEATGSARVNKVGFITPPAWLDISPMEFLRIAPPGTLVTQTLMRPAGFDYNLEHIRAAAPELTACAESLAAAGVDVIAQFGYPFSFMHGWQGAQELQARIENTVGRPFVMMGVEVVNALHHLKAKQVALAATYYTRQAAEPLLSFLDQAGISIALVESWQSLGLVKGGAGAFAGEGELDPMEWKTPAWAVVESLRRVSEKAPDVDAILVSGGGMRLLDIAADMERELAKPIVGGDISLYRGILRRLGISAAVPGHGRLLADLSS
jgi:arylmalonate decarboxylase